MDYEFFEALSFEEARAFLEEFCEVQRQGLEDMKPAAANAGIAFDYCLSSLADVLKWMIKNVRVHRVPVPEDEPWWIRQAHSNGLIEFDDESKTVLLRAAYYVGECFARRPGMRWTTGNVEYLGKNMPVVAGFRAGEELPPLIVVKNMFARIVGDGMPTSEVDATIEVWRDWCPSASM
jgi:hypothetical protein